MARNIVVTLRLDDRDLEEFKGLDFGILMSDIAFLAQQPLLKVSACHMDKEINYEIGYRSVSVRTEHGRPINELSYTVIDRANVIGSDNYSDQVGIKSYTQKDVDELRLKKG